MIKKILLTLSLLLVQTTLANEVRVSIMMTHWSVGGQIIKAGSIGHVANRLSNLNVTYGSDTARIVFRSYWMLAPEHLTDTLVIGGDQTHFSDFSYGLNNPVNRVRISCDEVDCCLLKNLFNVPNRTSQGFWRIFQEHQVPGTSGDSVTEKFDLVIVKNPYVVWYHMTPEKQELYKSFYRAVRDSVANNPDINLAFCFGTPATIGQGYTDSSEAKLAYDLAEWFDSDQFFTHTNDGPYKNVWKWNSFSHLCETAVQANRYCLKDEYFDGAPSGSHLSEPLGASVAQDSLVAFLERTVRDILIQRSGQTIVTKEDIDRKIMEFRKGNATEEEVQLLIKQYNEGGG